MTSVQLHEGDNRDHLRRLIDQGVRVHSVVTDPPYGLTSVVKRFGKEGAAPAKHGSDGAFARASGGFMGKQWDGTGIERDPEFWRLIWEILLPGGFVFAFSGSRTGHWQACAMETAGFIMHPMHGWVYGSGMPKAHNPCPGIDRLMGEEGGRNLLGETVRRIRPGADQNKDGTWEKLEDREYERGTYAPASPEAQQWDGWRHGTQSQKPALEPIYLGQKPFSEKTGALNLLKHGVGAVNIDDCRVLTDEVITTHSRSGEAAVSKGIYGDSAAQDTHQSAGQSLGRWPANLLHDGSPEVVALFPDSKGQIAKASTSNTQRAGQNTYGDMARGSNGSEPRGDDGSAARFFNSFPDGPDAPAIIYHAKATKADRAGSKHPTVKAVGLIEHLIRHITPPGGTVLDPFAGSGTTGEAARRLGFDCILMEQDPEYADFLRERFDLPPEYAKDLADDFLMLPVDDFLTLPPTPAKSLRIMDLLA
jgi:DNA modification methylase